MIKNPTPRNVSFYTSIILTLIIGLVTFYLERDPAVTVSISAVTFIVSYFLFLYAIEVFIYRKIKLVYKNIHNLKVFKGEPLKGPESLALDPISDVEKEVQSWAEDKVLEIAQLKTTENYRKEFLGNVSHELKTPIFNIQGYINTLLDGAMDDPGVRVHFLKKAAKSTDRLAVLVDDLENISRLESGFLTIEMEYFDIQELVRDVFESMELLGAEKKITFEFKEGSNRPFMVEADKGRIRQVLVNLIVNSIKYGWENGRTTVGLFDLYENILVEISDNGIGIPEEHLPRLFERFYRVDKSRSREDGGSGLGLAIVKHIIEAHDQSINVRSSHGIGTTFGFTLKKA